MTDRYDELRVSPDPERAEELRQLLHAQLERSSLDEATASRRRLTIASPAGGAEFKPMEEMHMSDHPADREHKTRWRMPAVAAAIVVLGVGAIAFTVSNTNADDPDGVSQAPTPTAAPTTPAPTTTVAPRIATYTGIPGVPITYTVPDSWDDPSEDGFVVFGESSMVNFWDVVNVYADGCEHTLLSPPLGPTVDDIANVWATLPGFTATTPVDVTVDGYAGKQVDFTVPEYPTVVDPATGDDEADCVQRQFALWTANGHGGGPSFWAQAPAQQHRLWIIDVDGTRLVIVERSAFGTTPERLADMDQFLASIQIG